MSLRSCSIVIMRESKPIFSISAGLSLATAYVVMGKCGLLLAIPPGYATGIFPPAGVALAAAYLWGWSTLPWTFLGALTLNVWSGGDASNATSAMTAACIGAASALQAWLGAQVLHRVLGLNTRLESVRDIGSYLLWAPLICLISASLSVGSLRLLGVIQADQMLWAWSIWGIGDTLGVVSFFPLVLALFGSPASVWDGRRTLVVSVMGTLLAIVVLGYVNLSQWEADRTARKFNFQAARVADQIQDNFKQQEYILDQLDAALSLSVQVPMSREAFKALAQPSLNRFPMLQAIEWAPEVLSNRRRMYESVHNQSDPGFRINQRKRTGESEPASDRPVYYPVTYVEPRIGNERAVGFDLLSNPARQAAMSQALHTEGAVATEPVTLVQEQGGQLGILLFRRVNSGAHTPGVVLTVLRVGDFLEKFLVVGGDLDATLTDTQLGQIIYGVPPARPAVTEFVTTLQFGGRRYKLQATPSVQFLSAHRSLQSWGLLVGGVVGSGLIGAILLLVTGTTNQVRAQVEERTQQLCLQNEVLQAVIDHVPVRVFWKDRALRYLGCNPEFAKDAGKDSPGDLIGKDDFQLGWTKEAQLYRADDLHVMESGVSKINFEEPQTTPSGHLIWLRTSKVPLRNQHQEVIGILGIYDDITVSRAIAMELQDSEARFRRLFDSSPDPVWIIEGHRFVECNQAAVNLMGYPDKESLIHTHPSALSPDYQPDGEQSYSKAERMMQMAQETGLNRFEWVHRRKDGTDFFAEVTLSTMTLQGWPVMYCVWRDISERKAAQTQLEQAALKLALQNDELNVAHKEALVATEAKSAFLAAMSHEIRTPLNVINGMAELLLGTALDQEQTGFVGRFSRAATHLLELINDILDLSKIEAGQLRLEAISFNPRDVMTTVKELMEVSAKAKQLELTVQVHPELPELVLGDPTRLRQVLMNLVGNAVKFTASGHVVIRAGLESQDRWRFEVSDTGIGIPEDMVGTVFENFTQGDSTITRKFGGTGLGLAICKRVVELMQGNISVRSTVGMGSTFEFTARLPVAKGDLSEEHRQLREQQHDPGPTRRLRILLADDLADNRDVVALFLKDLPYAIEMTENGAAAVEKFQQAVYDLVFMDMQMPIMDGLTATTAIRDWEQKQGRRATPIIALTAHALKEERDKSLAAGCTAHLTKPIKKRELLAAIAQYAAQITDQAA